MLLLLLPLLLPLAVQGLYSASAGTHPGGSVAGCAGHNSAGCVVKDMGLGGKQREALSCTAS
jgi:phytoene dehydrogenase-like protein